AVVALADVILEAGVVRLERQGGLEALRGDGVVAALERRHAEPIIVADALLFRGRAAPQAQGQPDDPADPPHTAPPPAPTRGKGPPKGKARSVRRPSPARPSPAAVPLPVPGWRV